MEKACPGDRGKGTTCKDCLHAHSSSLMKECKGQRNAVKWYCGGGGGGGDDAPTFTASMVLMMGGGMTHYNGNQFDVVSTYTGRGIQVIGLCFSANSEDKSIAMKGDGWETTPADNPKPILAAACRPATALRYFFDHQHGGDTTRAFGIFGHSGGSAAASYSLAHFGAGEFVDYAQVSAGPVFGRIDLGCENSTPFKRLPSQCAGQPAAGKSTTYGAQRGAAMDSWTGEPSGTCCGSTPPSSAALARLKAGSVVSPGAVYVWPKTFVGFWYCNGNEGSCSNGQGAYFVDQVVNATQHDARLSDNVGITCIGGQCHGEGAWTDPTGFAEMKAETLKQLVPRHT